MKRVWSVLLSILLGAFAVGLGTGYFLYLANKDRAVLAQEAEQAKLQMQQTLQESQKAIEDANRKLQQANQEVDKAQTALKALELERSLIMKAVPIFSPPAKDVLGWHSVISEPFGIAIQYPPNSLVIQNDAVALSIARTPAKDDISPEQPWLRILPPSATIQQQLNASISSSTEITYLIDGHVIYGRTGSLASQDQAGVFQIFENGTSTQLIWMQQPPEYKEKSWQKPTTYSIQEILSTIKFK